MVKFGIAPYFVKLLNSQLKNLQYFVALFNESFNYVAKKKKKQKKHGEKAFDWQLNKIDVIYEQNIP